MAGCDLRGLQGSGSSIRPGTHRRGISPLGRGHGVNSGHSQAPARGRHVTGREGPRGRETSGGVKRAGREAYSCAVGLNASGGKGGRAPVVLSSSPSGKDVRLVFVVFVVFWFGLRGVRRVSAWFSCVLGLRFAPLVVPRLPLGSGPVFLGKRAVPRGGHGSYSSRMERERALG